MLSDPLTAVVFRTLARARRARAFHPRGVTFPAVVTLDDPTAIAPGRYDALVRLSRGAGLPTRLPDIHGIAVRLLDAHGAGRHQDLLVTSVASPGWGRSIPWPGRGFAGTTYSSIAPYRTDRGWTLLGARSPAGPHFDLEDAAEVVRAGGCRLELLAAGKRRRWRRIGEVVAHGEPLGDDDDARLGFDPWNTGDTLVPVGWVNRLRRTAYPASRAGRPGATRD